MHILLIALALAIVLAAFVLQRRYTALRREDYIRHAELPRGLFDKLRAKHPQLTLKDCQLVAHGLRQFFLAHLKSGRRFVAMPSQVVDDLWHEFILYTRNYEHFCRLAFGRFMHHTPAVVLGSARQQNEGLRRCWWQVCREENINPNAPTRLPLLFALDAKLNIPNGFVYVPDCSGVRRAGADGSSSGSTTYCGGHFSDPSIDGGTAGLGDGGAESAAPSDAGGGSDGCGGGGCGGGD